ncbi:hypothetical protein B0O41_0160 [Propionibacteriaceae bacterium ES.041]|uniref:hypothetical protein n=1 Tax=Enemella evansiae TaxID=2016499 RepID=UPI000B973AEF|nr:hypothetical protein [Enemella evansiae]OYN96175.1 hypothetical protein CGZ96_12935 [Enemella evansiae]OYO11127.1 hypothetical protein CGZ98_11010 [Enemella evansiae]PFG65396.1 hypothetical protein B0O41_0160 [Propionibacteriaceae bacterium ES.041]
MTFEQLKENWNTRPITDSNLADVVDLFLALRDRHRNSLLLLITDDAGRPIPTPIMLNEVDWHIDPTQDRNFIEFLTMIADHGSGVLVGIGHPQPGVTLDDLRWRAALAKILPRIGLRPLGFFTGDMDTVVPIPDSADLAA